MNIAELKTKHYKQLNLLSQIEIYKYEKEVQLTTLDCLPDFELENSKKCKDRLETLTNLINSLTNEYKQL